mgnify:FL=1
MIRELVARGVSKSEIAKIFKVNRDTVSKFIKNNGLEQEGN